MCPMFFESKNPTYGNLLQNDMSCSKSRAQIKLESQIMFLTSTKEPFDGASYGKDSRCANKSRDGSIRLHVGIQAHTNCKS